MKIKQKPKLKEKHSMYNRRYKGHPSLTINGNYTRHFANNQFYSDACYAISTSTFSGVLDFRNFVSRLVNGFEEERFRDVIEKYEFSQPLFVPGAQMEDGFVDS